MNKTNGSDYIIFTHKGVDYLTFPQAWFYITGKETSRDALHQKIIRNKDENTLKVGRYVFVALSFCDKLRLEYQQGKRAEKLSILTGLDLTDKEIQRIIELKKNKLLNKI